MYIEASSPRQLGDYAVLNSPALSFRGLMCVTFYYHMYGAAIGNLTVTVNGKTLFSKSGNQGRVWLKAQVNTSAFGMHKVGHKKSHGVAVSRYEIWLYLLELATVLNWRWRVGLLCPIFFLQKGNEKPSTITFLVLVKNLNVTKCHLLNILYQLIRIPIFSKVPVCAGWLCPCRPFRLEFLCLSFLSVKRKYF